METFMALPGADYIYSEYDLGIIADILTTADHSAQKLAKKGKGEREASCNWQLFKCACMRMAGLLTRNVGRRQWGADLAKASESL